MIVFYKVFPEGKMSANAKYSFIALSLVILLLAGCEKRHVAAYKTGYLERNIVFANAGETQLKLDIVWPKGPGPFPALVYIYGSGFGYWPASRFACMPSLDEALSKGYVATEIDYRQTTEKVDGRARWRFPGLVYDAKAAVRWLRANARKYNIDPDHIGAVGFSSGAYLALMLGVTSPIDRLEGDSTSYGYSSAVQAVASCAGPTDFVTHWNDRGAPEILGPLMGGTPEQYPEEFRKASPLTYVSGNSAPTLLIHGDRDGNVSADQSVALSEKMKKVGANVQLIIRKNRGHEDFTRDPEVFEFMDRQLKSPFR
jgi:acetyl esterase/lipase